MLYQVSIVVVIEAETAEKAEDALLEALEEGCWDCIGEDRILGSWIDVDETRISSECK